MPNWHDVALEDPCLLFAVRRERLGFRGEFRPHQRFPGAPCWARFCGPAWLTVLVVETGVGAPAMQQALDWIFKPCVLGNLPYRPRVIISAGFCGALQEGYRIGDIILATEIVDRQGGLWPATWPGTLPAGKWQPALHRGRLLTSARLIGRPEEKARLGIEHQAVAVDMETALLARACHKHGVPFGAVRAVSDELHMPLSERLVGLLSGGSVSPWRVAANLARSPRLAAELWRLARHTRLAAAQLGTALGELLTLTLPWAQE